MHIYSSYQLILDDVPNVSVRDDFIKMNADLMTAYQFAYSKPIKGYAFSTLFDRLASASGFLSQFSNVDLCITLSLSLEFDPLYSHLGAYLLDQYNCKCEVIDVSEQTPLPIFSALSLLQSYFLTHPAHRCVVLYFEQKGSLSAIPNFNTVKLINQVGAIFFSNA